MAGEKKFLQGNKLGIILAIVIAVAIIVVGILVCCNAGGATGEKTEGNQAVAEKTPGQAVGQTDKMDKTDQSDKAERKEAKELVKKIREELERKSLADSNVLDIELVVSGITSSSYESVQTVNTSTADATDDLSALAQGILDEILTGDMTEFLKVKAIHDYIVMHIDYDYDDYLADTIPASSYTAEGALETNYGVCAAYAKLFKLLCNNAGIECDYVVGMGRTDLHAWNQVKVDGEWYNIDVTWDDPVSTDKAFDDHSTNNYSYFLLSDADMYKNHTPYNAKHECTATSIGNSAFEYGCPWLEMDPGITFVRSDEELEATIAKMLDQGMREFELITISEHYTKEVMREKITEYTVKAGYDWNAISGAGTMSFASNYLKKWSYVMYQEPRKFEFFTAQENVQEFVRSYVEEKGTNWTTMTPSREISFYASTLDVLTVDIKEWALLNGAELSYGWGNWEQEITKGFYYGVMNIRACGYDVLSSTEEITAHIQAAYDRGETEYTFLYDYRGTGMNANDAQYAIIYATPLGITNGHSVLNTETDGLVLFCQYFR